MGSNEETAAANMAVGKKTMATIANLTIFVFMFRSSVLKAMNFSSSIHAVRAPIRSPALEVNDEIA